MTRFLWPVACRLHRARLVVLLMLLVLTLLPRSSAPVAWGSGRGLAQPVLAQSPMTVVTTIAGSGVSGFVDGPAAWAKFALYSGYTGASGLAVDAAGVVYVADSLNGRIRKITLDGAVSSLAGSGASGFADGRDVAAQFWQPTGIAANAYGVVYVADSLNGRIRKIALDRTVSTLAGSGRSGFADGPGAAAEFWLPAGVAVNATGVVYIADWGTNRIRKITPDGSVSTFAGSGKPGYADGLGASAQFSVPQGVAVDTAGVVYVADTANNRIRRITPDGTVSTLAGSGESGYADGPGESAQFNVPQGIAVDTAGVVYVADTANNRIRRITPDGEVSPFAGSGRSGYADGSGAYAQFDRPAGVAVDVAGMVYVADTGNFRIRKIAPVTLQPPSGATPACGPSLFPFASACSPRP